MDKSFNFFKTKIKKQQEKIRQNSKSNSSKRSYSKNSDKIKSTSIKPAPLTKKQRQIREAIEFRYERSKIKNYTLTKLVEKEKKYRKNSLSSHSSQMPEFKHVKKLKIVDLKEYHHKIESNQMNASQQKKRFQLRFKIKQNNSSQILKTEGNESSEKNANLSKHYKNTVPNKLKNTEEWKFISIELKEDLSEPKNRKTEVKINSHRSYNVQEKPSKIKPSSSLSKYFDKVPKLKYLSKLNRTKF